MCIIAAKPANTPMPNDTTLRRMWDNNPDGAGLMYPVTLKKNGKAVTKVQINKGYMDFDSFKAALAEISRDHDLDKLPVVMHFRITTHGGTCPELTHPFPVSSSESVLKKLKSTAEVGIAHNGVIHSVTPRKGLSDTAEYTLTQLAPLRNALPKFYENSDALTLIRNAIGSKMAILSADGKITTIGDFTEDGGILYSNTSYAYDPYQFRSAWTCDGGGWKWDTLSAKSAPWDDSKPRKLMNLTFAPGAFIIRSNGEPEDMDYEDCYAIDSKGRVYCYDSILEVFVRLSGAKAYTARGMNLKYDSKHASWEDTMDEDTALSYYDEIGKEIDEDDGEILPI